MKKCTTDKLLDKLCYDMKDAFVKAGVEITIDHKTEYVYKVLFDLCNSIGLEANTVEAIKIYKRYLKLRHTI